MYDELVRRLRDNEHEIDCSLCDRDCCYPDGKFHGKCIIIEAADAIEELQKQRDEWESHAALAESFAQGWIPVTERLPEFEGAVLCMRKSNVYGVRPYQEILYVDEYGFKNYDDIYLTDGVVTHWMPLPQPPEEGE